MIPVNDIVAVYTPLDADKQQFINLLAQSYLLAKTQAYNQAISRTNHVVQIHHPWQPSSQDVPQAQEWATPQVESIVSTYEELLRSAIEQALQQTQEAIDESGQDDHKKKHELQVLFLLSTVGNWFKQFLPWKTKQIANVTMSTGANAGTNQFIEDVQDEAKTDEVVDDGKSMLRVVVLPAHSSSDECEAIAGKSFALDEAPDLPMHPNCIHYKEIIIFDGNESMKHEYLSEDSKVMA